MRDYAELVEALRDPERACNAWDAADAIEELLAELVTIRNQLPKGVE